MNGVKIIDVKFRLAEGKDLDIISNIITNTINTIYPKYYPKGAVDKFLWYHQYDYVKEDILKENLYAILLKDEVIGVIGKHEDEITRFFIKPEYQHKGIGTLALSFMEGLIFMRYDVVKLDASLSGKKLYIKAGYKFYDYEMIEAEDGSFLCFDKMEKIKKVAY